MISYADYGSSSSVYTANSFLDVSKLGGRKQGEMDGLGGVPIEESDGLGSPFTNVLPKRTGWEIYV